MKEKQSIVEGTLMPFSSLFLVRKFNYKFKFYKRAQWREFFYKKIKSEL